MKEKITLTRRWTGEYVISKGNNIFMYDLCPRLTKKWLGLKRQLKDESIEGYLEVKFTPIKKKK